jgi:hypothetical protein
MFMAASPSRRLRSLTGDFATVAVLAVACASPSFSGETGGVFYSVPQCRILDTRVDGPALVDGTERPDIPIGDDTVAPECGIPAAAVVVAVNVTVVPEPPTGAGYLAIYEGGTSEPDPAADGVVHFNGGVRANNAAVRLSPSGTLNATLHLDSGTEAHLILDVVGYYGPEEAPAVLSTVPAHQATDVAPGANVQVDFSEGVDFSAASFSLWCPFPDFFPGGFAVSPANPESTSVTLDPTGDLPAGVCQVTVVGLFVNDLDSLDPPDTMAGDHVFSFTVADGAPAVDSTSPADGATGVAATTEIVINFTEPVDIESSADFELLCDGNPEGFTVTSPAFLPASTSTVVLTPDAHLPVDTCTVRVLATIGDTDLNDPPDQMVADFYFSFTIESGAP